MSSSGQVDDGDHGCGLLAGGFGAPASKREKSSATLLEAATIGSVQLVRECLAVGVPATCVDDHGRSPLHKSVLMGFDAIAEELIGADAACVRARDLMKNTPLHSAAFGGDTRLVKMLLGARADANAADVAGNTPLHRAVLEGHMQAAGVLLQSSADPNARGSEHNTPLHFATLSGAEESTEIVKLLLDFGADATAVNRFGKTARDLALRRGEKRVAMALEAVASRAVSPPQRRAVASGPHGQEDVFGLLIRLLASPQINEVVSSFQMAHKTRFVRSPGGDYPLILSTLHAQYRTIVSSLVEALLARYNISWESAAAACETAAFRGQCSAQRVRLISTLAALDDFEAFFELMTKGKEEPEVETAHQLEAHSPPSASQCESDQRNSRPQTNAAAAAAAEPSAPPAPRDAYMSEAPPLLPSNSFTHLFADVHVEEQSSAGATLSAMSRDKSPPPSHTWTMPAAAHFSEQATATPLADVRLSACSANEDSQLACTTLSSVASSCLEGEVWRYVDLEGTIIDQNGDEVRATWRRGKRVGTGSTGEVFLVDDDRIGRFAAKLVMTRDEESVAQLKEEIAIMQKLRHANIVQYLGSATHQSDQYILMEYLGGGSVHALIQGQHPNGLPMPMLHSYGKQMLAGLHFLHGEMVIHRDLKGDNLLRSSDGAIVKLADFGSSQRLQTDLTLTSEVRSLRGSPYWMSPEHIQGFRCGRKADIWSFGCVLLEMLTGSPPWHDPAAPHGHVSVFQVLNRIVAATTPPPMPAEMPHALRSLMLACFNRDIEQRPTTTELLDFDWIRGGDSNGTDGAVPA